MNTGQMLITIGAIFLLATVILTVNKGLLSSNSVMINNRYDIISASLATSMIERATSKAFDEKSDTLGLKLTTELTQSNALGLDAGESINDPNSFDDFDDYNCYKTTPKTDTLQLEGSGKQIIFYTNCQVNYVTANNPETITTGRTWHKRMIVKVYSSGIEDTVKLSTVYSYWYFR